MGLFDFMKKKDKEEVTSEEVSTEEKATQEGVDLGGEKEEASVTFEEISPEEVTKEDVSEDVKEASDKDNASDSEDTSAAKESAATEETLSAETPKKKGFFGRLMEGLAKTRNSMNESFSRLFSLSQIDDDFYDELEETLIMADLGLDTTETILEDLKKKVKENHLKTPAESKELIMNIIRSQMDVDDTAYDFEEQKTVLLIIGVNGVGKTTSIGKLAHQYKARGKKVLLAAADTFRAAAIDQLKTWANRAEVDIIAQAEGGDPSAVVYDAVSAAKARNVDILICDTAGRLHNKKNLMDELAKMKRIIEKEYPDAHLETLIVLDGSTGQNALEQAKQFSTVTKIDGIILTKLDGTAKGGIAIAIQSELDVPVKFIGVGEKIDDLQRFDPKTYVDALFADMDIRSDIEMLIEDEE